MNDRSVVVFVKNVLDNMPSDWLKLTTHRLDIYNEELAKGQFLEEFENLQEQSYTSLFDELNKLPTAYDYIRLGHPLSCVLEWFVSKVNNLNPERVISFSSKMMPILAILRKNLLDKKTTQIFYKQTLPSYFDEQLIKKVYNYGFELIKVESEQDIPSSTSTTIYLDEFRKVPSAGLGEEIDFVIDIHPDFGSLVLVNKNVDAKYISEIQHVRRRESIAMTPNNSLSLLRGLLGEDIDKQNITNNQKNKDHTLSVIKEITSTSLDACFGSSGLSVQYAIMMGLIHSALENHKGKSIKFIVPPNCYGGTNDQARRVAACLNNVEILDLPVDREHDMVQSIEEILEQVASIDAVPYIIAEIPTNPRVEVPDLDKLQSSLSKVRKTKEGSDAIAPVFILDQTFCPNKKFLGAGDALANIKTISYVSGSKFPSGGLCTAGYCVANKKAEGLMSYIAKHLKLCDNEATNLQVDILSAQMPSMIKRIDDAYKNTRKFVDFIQESLPSAKINFVDKELSEIGFTPSVFSLDLPTKGDSHEQRESYKRDLNLKLINLMINEIPDESKYCVSYGQLKGCYWTIPATSTQGTTKEGDKDYIVRVSVSADFDLEHHKKVFSTFCQQYIK